MYKPLCPTKVEPCGDLARRPLRELLEKLPHYLTKACHAEPFARFMVNSAKHLLSASGPKK
jgi:hypothetical protein